MGNLITKYQNFLFEEESISTQISNTRLEMSKVNDEGKAIRSKYDNALGSASNDEAKKLKAESDFLAAKSQIYGKMIPIMNKLKSQLDQKLTELKA
jgi:hypothetical protein